MSSQSPPPPAPGPLLLGAGKGVASTSSRTFLLPLALVVLAACNVGGSSVSSKSSAAPSAASIPTPSASPLAIGDACVVGTWVADTATEQFTLNTSSGPVTLMVTGGAGGSEHLTAAGQYTYIFDGSTPEQGSGSGHTVVLNYTGRQTALAHFSGGTETLDSWDFSKSHESAVDNGANIQLNAPVNKEYSYSYTCSASSLAITAPSGSTYKYHRTSTTP